MAYRLFFTAGKVLPLLPVILNILYRCVLIFSSQVLLLGHVLSTVQVGRTQYSTRTTYLYWQYSYSTYSTQYSVLPTEYYEYSYIVQVLQYKYEYSKAYFSTSIQVTYRYSTYSTRTVDSPAGIPVLTAMTRIYSEKIESFLQPSQKISISLLMFRYYRYKMYQELYGIYRISCLFHVYFMFRDKMSQELYGIYFMFISCSGIKCPRNCTVFISFLFTVALQE